MASAAGDYQAALGHYERELLEARIMDTEVDLEVCEANVAEALIDVGRPEDALPHAVNAVRMASAPGAHRRALLTTLARVQTMLGDHDAALATALEIQVELIASGRSREQIDSELAEVNRAVRVPAWGGGTADLPRPPSRRID
ncbi:hypothetical protein F0U44_18990 [Nocardioides humilatus]|uniref:Tetratricopeptide repeat protein n=1 Tax=Nocardioides humilatus TaxID=2607660 RepID=A0A5B1L712_9ACTN|nr:hypothetical protein [Nocardioides humilatus]KAA1416402.1 hypothetical protein F0U44_18990 [Nocardioides humilatus]